MDERDFNAINKELTLIKRDYVVFKKTYDGLVQVSNPINTKAKAKEFIEMSLDNHSQDFYIYLLVE